MCSKMAQLNSESPKINTVHVEKGLERTGQQYVRYGGNHQSSPCAEAPGEFDVVKSGEPAFRIFFPADCK
jgi:hypothetical protein